MDYAAQAEVDARVGLGWSSGPIPAEALAPRYSNPAKITTDDDDGVFGGGDSARVLTTSYETQAEGLVKSQTVDPGATLDGAGNPVNLRLSTRRRRGHEPHRHLLHPPTTTWARRRRTCAPAAAPPTSVAWYAL